MPVIIAPWKSIENKIGDKIRESPASGHLDYKVSSRPTWDTVSKEKGWGDVVDPGLSMALKYQPLKI